MGKLFDPKLIYPYKGNEHGYWYEFTLYHSRFYAKKNSHPISKLCVADKLAFTIPPKWLYILLVNLSGEVYEYMDVSRQRSGKSPLNDKNIWYPHVYKYMQDWVYVHKDNLNDTWTKKELNTNRTKGITK